MNEASTGMGVMLVMNNQINAARDVFESGRSELECCSIAEEK